MIDLCIDARMAYFSGIGTYIRELLPYFRKSFLRVTLLVDQLENEWCRGYDQIVLNAPIYSIREQILFPLKIPTCDIFFSPHYNVPIFPIHAKKRIVTIHDVCHLVYGSSLEKMYAKFMLKRALKADRVITVSDFSKEEIQKYFGECSIERVPIGANLRHFTKRPHSESIRKKYKLPKRFIFFLGNQKIHKNLNALKKAFSKADLGEVKLVIAGKGTQVGKIADVDLPAIYSMAEAFVFPSLYEGFGLPPLEAMGCGCPTVVSKAASIPEVCGDASLYFDPNSLEEMSNAIRQVILDQDERTRLIEEGLKRVKDFSWKLAAERHMKLFEEVMNA